MFGTGRLAPVDPVRRRPGGAGPVGDPARGQNAWLSSGRQQPLPEHPAVPATRTRAVPVRKEIRRLGKALARHDGNVLAAAVRLLALTGSRKSGIVTLQWQDFRDGHLFPRDGKTAPRTVWLSLAARTVLDGLPRTGAWVFSERSGSGPERGSRKTVNEGTANCFI